MEAMITYPGGHRACWCMHVTGHYTGEPPWTRRPSPTRRMRKASDEPGWDNLDEARPSPPGILSFSNARCFACRDTNLRGGFQESFLPEKKDVRLWEQRNSESNVRPHCRFFLFEMCMVGRLVSLPGATWSTCWVGGARHRQPLPVQDETKRGTAPASPTVSTEGLTVPKGRPWLGWLDLMFFVWRD